MHKQSNAAIQKKFGRALERRKPEGVGTSETAGRSAGLRKFTAKLIRRRPCPGQGFAGSTGQNQAQQPRGFFTSLILGNAEDCGRNVPSDAPTFHAILFGTTKIYLILFNRTEGKDL